MRARVLAGLLTTLALVTGAVAVTMLSASGAAAASTADVSVSQRISGGTAAGATVDTVTVHNAGSATATGVNLALLLKSTSSSYSVHASRGTCQLQPAPPGYLAMASCQLGSLASRHSVADTITWHGAQGKAFTSFASVGIASPADPKFGNNSSTVSSYFGPRADLRLTETAAAGKSAGTAKIVSTVVNRGPNTANALQLTAEIKSSGYKSVHASSNLSASCQFIPAANGYNRAVSCVTNTLATGKKWAVTFAYTGTKGGALTVKTSVSANGPIDPVTTNNSLTKSTKYKS
jgi:hypothetical protein